MMLLIMSGSRHGDEHTRADQQMGMRVRQVVRWRGISSCSWWLQALGCSASVTGSAPSVRIASPPPLRAVPGGKIVQNLNVSFPGERTKWTPQCSRVQSVSASMRCVTCRVKKLKTYAGVVRARCQPIHLVTARQQPAVRGFPEAHMVAFRAAVHFLR